METSQPRDNLERGLSLRTRTPGATATSEHLEDDRWSVSVQRTHWDNLSMIDPHPTHHTFDQDIGLADEPRGSNEAEPWNSLQVSAGHQSQRSTRTTQPTQPTPESTSSVYYSAGSGGHSIFFSAASGTGEISKERMQRLRKVSEYEAILQTAGVGPIDSMLEQDWSGRGQHAQFQKHEVNIINELLPIQDTLGKGKSAVVHSVKCRRILLARKNIYTNRHFTKRQTILEVAHLTRINHAHVVRLIGTYTWQKELSILMYPAAEYNLASFLESLLPRDMSLSKHYAYPTFWQGLMASCRDFFPCLSSALHHIHKNLTKHMDIKPQNILVRLVKTWYTGYAKVYISDFGIARSYQTLEATDTDGATSFTRKYAAPGVVQQDFRGLPADIFSMGCVFTEICTTLHRLGRTHNPWEKSIDEKLNGLLSQSADPSYQNHIDSIRNLIKSRSNQLDQNNTINTAIADLIVRMLSRDSAERPTALDLTQLLPPLPCCNLGPDELEGFKNNDECWTISDDAEDSSTADQRLVDLATTQDVVKSSGASCCIGDYDVMFAGHANELSEL